MEFEELQLFSFLNLWFEPWKLWLIYVPISYTYGIWLTSAYHRWQEACIVLMLNALTLGLRRGPHHPHGGTPVDHKHHHYKPRGSESLTGDSQLLHDIKHIEEDSGVLTSEALANMTPEELEFHYFSAHDFDKNSMLDGLELLKAVYHTTEHEEPDPDADTSIEPEANDLDALIALVDRTLASDDMDGDGYISYAEYRAARANASDRTPRVVLAKR